MSENLNELVKVRFAFAPDEDGWPPVRSEGIWARRCGDAEYELDNAPWFARGFAYGDRVRASPDADGVLWVEGRTAWPGRYTIRVIPKGAGSADEQLQSVMDRFSPLGAECEGALPAFKLVTLDIPPTARIAEIKAALRQGETDGAWGYEEGCIDPRWAAL